uniref:leucine-rich repeat protein n=1 Tax=Segatella copri TaxID=165179 RepID=UPI003FEECC91
MKHKYILSLILLFASLVAKGTVLYPGLSEKISYQASTGEHAPTWSCNNPTIHLSSTGFLCNVTAQAYFSGTATVTLTFKDDIGTSSYTRTKKWTFTCIDTKISISPTTKSLKNGEKFQIKWNFDRTTYLTPSVQFTGYDENIVNVQSDGTVEAKKEGSTKIYVKSNIGTNSIICNVKVSKANSSISYGNSPYDEWDDSKAKIVRISDPGALEDIISSEKYTIKDLTIVGPLNGADLRFLREMIGVDENNNKTNGKLESLDLKEAVFVEGGPWYVKAWQNYLYTEETAQMPGYAFAWLRKLKRIRFPRYCTALMNGALLQDESLEQISIPPGVTSLDRESFNGGYGDMSLTNLYLPASLASFNADIYMCKNLTDIYCYATTPPTINPSNRFKSQTNISNGTLYVPKGCAKLYWKAEGWRDFKNIKETLDVRQTLYVNVGANGSVYADNDEMVRQIYPVYYGGCRAFEVPTAGTGIVQFKVVPDEGYFVSKVTLNGENVPISSQGIINIWDFPDLANLNIEFSSATAIKPIIGNREDESYEIFTISGLPVYKGNKNTQIENFPKGAYIIKREKTAKKFFIK